MARTSTTITSMTGSAGNQNFGHPRSNSVRAGRQAEPFGNLPKHGSFARLHDQDMRHAAAHVGAHKNAVGASTKRFWPGQFGGFLHREVRQSALPGSQRNRWPLAQSLGRDQTTR